MEFRKQAAWLLLAAKLGSHTLLGCWLTAKRRSTHTTFYNRDRSGRRQHLTAFIPDPRELCWVDEI